MKKFNINLPLLGTTILIFVGPIVAAAANRIVTTLANTGPGSLRQVLAECSDGDSITFATNGLLTLSPEFSVPVAQLIVSNDVSILGPGPGLLRIASESSRAIYVPSNTTAYLSGLTIGRCRDGADSGSGGLGGAALFNAGTLVVSNCVVTSNTFYAGLPFIGGAVSSIGTLAMIDSAVVLNIVENRSYYEKNFGGGIYNGGILTLVRCNISSNATVKYPFAFEEGIAGDGGGLFNSTGATAIIESSLFAADETGNGGDDGTTHGGDGGAVYNAGTASIRASLFVGNRTGFGGHGGAGVFNTGDIRLTNCTFYGNMTGFGGGGGNGENFAPGASGGNGGNGGGLCNIGGGIAVNCTFASNQVAAGGIGGLSQPGGAVRAPSGTNGAGAGVAAVSSIELLNCIVATNNGVTPTDVSGAIASLGHNLFASLSGGAMGTVSDLTNINALLAPLADNGGRTMTCSLFPGSPALDAGDDGVLTTVLTDQRGRPRRSGAHVDIGAFEFIAPTFAGLRKLSNGAVALTTVSDTPFNVVANPNVAAPSNQWINLGPATTIGPGVYEFTDTTATNNPYRFFRLRWP